MRRPDAAGRVLEALEPMAKKLTDLEGRALQGAAMPVTVLIGECAIRSGRSVTLIDSRRRGRPASRGASRRPCTR